MEQRQEITPQMCYDAYTEANGNKTKAAETLGIPRTTFRRKLDVYEEEKEISEVQSKSDLEVIKLRKVNSELRKALKTAQLEQLADEEVGDFLRKVQNSPVEKDNTFFIPVTTKQDQEPPLIPVAMLSDLHWAEIVDPEQVYGLNTYNMEIAAERLGIWARNVCRVCFRYQENNPYPGIVIAMAGDFLSGSIHDELAATNEADVLFSFLDIYSNLISVINTFEEKFGKVWIPCAYGNHSRLYKKPRHKDSAHSNLDWLLYKMLADHFKDNENVQFKVPISRDCTFQVYDEKFRLTHGDTFGGGNGFIGALGPITKGELKKRIAVGSYGESFSKMLMGHFHSIVCLDKVYANGSLVGFNEFAANYNFSYAPAKQLLFFVDKDMGCVSPTEIWCEEVPEKEVDCVVRM